MRIGKAVRSRGMTSPAARNGAARRARLEVEVLLAHGRAVLDDGLGVLRDLGAPVEPRVDDDAVARQAQRLDLAHRDAAVGDLGADEDAARLGEVGGHDVAAAGDLVGEPDVAGREDRDEGDGQQGEGGELEPHGAGDHREPPVGKSVDQDAASAEPGPGRARAQQPDPAASGPAHR